MDGQEGGVRRARPASPSPARSLPPTPPTSTSTRSPRRPGRPGGRRGHAFLQPRQRHAAAGDRARREDRAGRAGDRAWTSAGSIGKVPVVVGVCHGFVGNRMLSARSRRGRAPSARRRLAQRGRRRADRLRLSHGPVCHERHGRPRCRLAHAQGRRHDAPVIADALCEKGRFGQKTGRGFYIYEKGEPRAGARPGGRQR